jgi:hypothetical protein
MWAMTERVAPQRGQSRAPSKIRAMSSVQGRRPPGGLGGGAQKRAMASASRGAAVDAATAGLSLDGLCDMRGDGQSNSHLEHG